MPTHKLQTFENDIHDNLYEYLLGKGEIDQHLPECPDVEEKWKDIAEAYLPDGVREFNDYPTVSLGWMMYIGMALARYWDTEWEVYAQVENLYAYLRDKRDFDHMDEYIREEVLHLKGEDYMALEKLVGECASRVYNIMRHLDIEPGTKAAFEAYIAALRQLYRMGMAVELHRLGYHMTPYGS